MLKQTLKNTFVFIIALILGGLISYLFEQIGYLVYDKPDISAKEIFEEYIITAPESVFAWLLLSHSFGAMTTGFVLGRFLANNSLFLYKVAALFWMFYGMLSILYVPHPIWFTISDLCIYFPMVFLGHQFAFNKLHD